MSRLLDDDQELETQQRELTLSTGAILAIFLGLVLLCAVFFGFGYNLGRRSTTPATVPPVPAANDSEPAAPSNSTFDDFKPSPASASSPAAPSPSPATSNIATVKTAPVPSAAHTVAPPSHSPQPTPAAPPAPAHKPTAAPATTPGGSFVVQIAAISSAHKDDADLLVNALHNKGYDVAERTLPQDKLIHIQVGPFATKADAEAMRERLIVDGYNAIVK
jgi:cell division septation protein DedD